MIYRNIEKAVFLSRPNRFTAKVLLNGREETVHVKNTGRCKELLVSGCTVWLDKAENPNRKTGYDLVAVLKGERIFNIDSFAPNTVAYEFLNKRFDVLQREVRYKNSRFDLMGEKDGKKTFIEVKGVTLEKDSIAYFPDAPTLRGTKHLKELADAVKNGYGAELFLAVQFKGATSFKPNGVTDPVFEKALTEAKNAGVKIRAYGCNVSENEISVNGDEVICLDL